MCALWPQAAKLIRAPWSGNMKDENAVSCVHSLRLVATKPCTAPYCNNHTNLQSSTTACKLQKKYGRTNCSRGQLPLLFAIESTTKREEPEPCFAQLADRCSTRPLTRSQSLPYGTISKLRIHTTVPKCMQSC